MKRNLSINTYQDDILLFNTPTIGIIDDELLYYHTDTDAIKINLEKGSFTKENNDTILKITKDKCTLTLKSLNNTYDIDLEYYNFEYNDQVIVFTYKLISQENILKIVINIGSVIDEL